MNRKSIKFRDTRAAPGSQLHEALVNGDTKRANAIYEQCERDLQRLEGPASIDPALIGIGRRTK